MYYDHTPVPTRAPTYALYAPGSASFYALVCSVSIIVPLFFLALFMLYRNRHRLPFVKYKRRINLEEDSSYHANILEAATASGDTDVKVDHDAVNLRLEDLLDVDYSVYSTNGNDEEKGVFDGFDKSLHIYAETKAETKDKPEKRVSIVLDDHARNHTHINPLKSKHRRRQKNNDV